MGFRFMNNISKFDNTKTAVINDHQDIKKPKIKAATETTLNNLEQKAAKAKSSNLSSSVQQANKPKPNNIREKIKIPYPKRCIAKLKLKSSKLL